MTFEAQTAGPDRHEQGRHFTHHHRQRWDVRGDDRDDTNNNTVYRASWPGNDTTLAWSATTAVTVIRQ